MFALGQEVEIEDELRKKAGILQSGAELRDQLFEENQGKILKVIIGVVVGLYVINRFLMK